MLTVVFSEQYHFVKSRLISTVVLISLQRLKIWALTRETCLRGFANNTGADQPAHRRSLISAFVTPFVESIICKLATGEISIFWLVPVAKETGLKLALSETLDRFCRNEVHTWANS